MITKFLCRFLKPTSSVVIQSCHESSCASALSICGEGGGGGFKVTVMGAAGGIGQPLALLLKLNPLVRELALHDVSKVTPGVAADLSHMDTQAKVTGFTGPDQLPCAMKGTNLVVVAAGVPRKPGMTRDDLFKTNANIILNMANCLATCAPQAIVCIITNPVNSMVPVACEVLKKAGKLDPNRVLGVTTLDLVRSSAFVGAINGVDPKQVYVPVIGAHAGVTIVPLLSQSRPPLQLSDNEKIMKLTKRIQEAGTEVVKAKAGGGSATLSTAYASARLANSVLRGLNGESNVIEAAYIQTNIVPGVTYFATPLLLGRNGVEKNLGYGKLNDYEQQLVNNAIPALNKNIQTGEKFVNKSSSPC